MMLKLRALLSISTLCLLLLVPVTNHAGGHQMIALVQDSKPKYLFENGELTGLCGDLYRALATHLEEKGVVLEIGQVALPIKRILKQVESSANKIYCGAGRNAQREKRFVYAATPVYEVSNVVAAHVDEPYLPSSFGDLAADKVPVGALFGTSSASFLKKQPGVEVVEQIYSLDEALKLLALKRLRLFYYHDLGLNYLTKNSEYSLKVLPTKFRSTPQWIIYGKTMPSELSGPLEEVLAEMERNGQLQRIISNYL